MSVCELTGPYAYDLDVQVLWVAGALGVLDTQAPTDIEIATGVDLQPAYDLTDIIGWEMATEILKDGVWGPQELQRLGEQSIPDSRLMFAADRAGNDIRTLLARGDEGFIIILPSGPYLDHLTSPVNCYPVRVAQLTQQQRLRSGGGSQILVTFAIRDRVGENVTIVGP